MPQYQSFPGARGDSLSLDKLKALRLPVMEGRSFLDVGCNEGFFCGFADFAGATRSVGLDRSREFIERARARFSDCEFHSQGWDCLPDGPFDVILLASALHYAEDQPSLLHRLVDHLSPDGVLVLELGIVSSHKSEWVKVTRGIDERWFPSMRKLREILAPYASKWMGPSVNQSGDPVARHIMHVSHRRPVAYLLMQPPAHGKSSLADKLFVPAGIPVVSGDLRISRLARGEIESAPSALCDIVAKDFSPYFMDRAVEHVFDNGLGRELVATWLTAAGESDFAVDGYVPAAKHAEVCQHLVDAGYLPVVLNWDRAGPTLLGGPTLDKKVAAYYRSLRRKKSDVADAAGRLEQASAFQGYVDHIKLADGQLAIGGWVRNEQDLLPTALVVRLRGRIVTCEHYEVTARPDVCKRLDASHERLGFSLTLDVGSMDEVAALGSEFSVAPLGGRALRLTPGVKKLLARSE